MVEAYQSAVEELKRDKETLLAAAALLELGTVQFHQQDSRSGDLRLCPVLVVAVWCVALHCTGGSSVVCSSSHNRAFPTMQQDLSKRGGGACSLTPERGLPSVFITKSLARLRGGVNAPSPPPCKQPNVYHRAADDRH